MIAAGVVAGAVFGTLLVIKRDVATHLFGEEGYKTLLQLFLIAVLGGGVSLVYQAFNRDADLRAQNFRRNEDRMLAIRESRRRQLQDLVGQYNSVKRTRRLMRAKATAIRPGAASRLVRVATYDDLVQHLLDAQLSLEAVAHAVRADQQLFPDRDALLGPVRRAEDYLRSLITEYEEILPSLGEHESLIDIARLPVLSEFIGPYHEAVRFRRRFVRPMRRAISAIQVLVIDGSR